MATTHRKHIRHSEFNRIRHSENFLTFCRRQAERLYGTVILSSVTFDNTTNTVLSTAHGLVSGNGPIVLGTDGVLPTGLDESVVYWVNAATADTLTLHMSEEDAIAGTNAVTFTDNGTGTATAHDPFEALNVFLAMKDGKSPREIKGITDPANL